jgi:hypothetical protein
MTEAPMPFLGQVAALEVRTQYGVDVAVEDDLRSIMSFVLLEREAWFEDEVAFLQHSLAEGAHIVDVGANVGVYAAALAHAVGARGRWRPAGTQCRCGTPGADPCRPARGCRRRRMPVVPLRRE